ncbi:hypothetical protein SNOG_02252 [Parastagonospora nodorum SN15]|uniref:Uncharacterized protein n=1 Tax=Phaeosphaeria nodorum (strain SN15 / ATCC MYA-4574 / FGSC 10173) TaxID=321614 RepID=Q0V162_PHANO|nr:hypothetical protein SNOG_02252 [Parastagonospora nodorum SN15]EAT90464.2 hypothetical protein SNOG_02252 [Parastagonospora nodorum SN15]
MTLYTHAFSHFLIKAVDLRDVVFHPYYRPSTTFHIQRNMSNTGAPDLERSLITHQTPWSAQIANYKHYGVVTINSDPMRLLQQGTEAYAALEQVCIAQVTETKLLAAENKVLSNAVAQMQLLLPPSPPPPVTDITKLPKYKGSCHKELDGQSSLAATQDQLAALTSKLALAEQEAQNLREWYDELQRAQITQNGGSGFGLKAQEGISMPKYKGRCPREMPGVECKEKGCEGVFEEGCWGVAA